MSVQMDGYRIEGVSGSGNGPAMRGRAFPQAALDVRYPLIRQSGNLNQVVEPVAMLIGAPNGSNPADIPDEESTVFELDDRTFSALIALPDWTG